MSEKVLVEGAQLLKDWLKAHGISQRVFSDRVHASQATISNILKGGTRPGLALAQMIEHGTKFVSPDDLMLVTPVPASSWFTPEEARRFNELEETAERVKERQRGFARKMLAEQVRELMAEQDEELLKLGLAKIKREQLRLVESLADAFQKVEALRKVTMSED